MGQVEVGRLEVAMPWVWTDEIAAAVRNDRDVDPALISAWMSAPIAIQVSGTETPAEVAERLTAGPESVAGPASSDAVEG